MLTRRRILQLPGIAALGLLAGCSSSGTPRPAPSAGPQDRLRARAAADERSLLDRYGATLHRYPDLAAALAPLQAHHAAHLDALGGQPAGSGPGSDAAAGAAAGPAGAASPTSPPPAAGAGSAGATSTAGAGGSGGPAPATGATSTGPPPRSVQPPPAVPGTSERAVLALAAAEHAAARQRALDCLTADGALAGLLASIGASEASHASVLPAAAPAGGTAVRKSPIR